LDNFLYAYGHVAMQVWIDLYIMLTFFLIFCFCFLI